MVDEQDKAKGNPSDKAANDAKSQATIDAFISDSESEALEGSSPTGSCYELLRLGGDIIKRGEMAVEACRQRLEVIGDAPECLAERLWLQHRIDQLENNA
jgi:hypothetical protein